MKTKKIKHKRPLVRFAFNDLAHRGAGSTMALVYLDPDKDRVRTLLFFLQCGYELE